VEKQHHIKACPEDIAPYVLLPGDPHRVEKIASHWDESHFVADNREMVTYTGLFRGMPITCTSTGMGCPSTAIAVEELARCGARTLLRVGTCGGIVPEVQPGDFVIFDSACRFEGTTRCYAPIEFPAVADHEIVEASIVCSKIMGIKYHVGTSRCIDGLYTNRPDQNASFGNYRLHSWDYFLQDLQKMHVIAGDMESAAVMVLSRLFGLRGGAVCMCAANLLSSYEKGGDFDFNSIPSDDELEEKLIRISLEIMYKLYQNDQARETVK
jgi:uridine phosphorylase